MSLVAPKATATVPATPGMNQMNSWLRSITAAAIPTMPAPSPKTPK
ncbi:MAG: hypothetical protein Q8L14_41100 [Myxococcales bacterium]|nr:hypothetical protein [Myxococcales bacterium]